MDLLQVCDRFFRASQIRLGNDFEQRRAGTIQIDAACRAQTFVGGLARILFKMCARDADRFDRPIVQQNIQRARCHDRQFVLTDLIALWQVGIKIILAREHLRPGGQTEFHCHTHGLSIEDREYAGIAKINEISLAVRRRAVGRGRTGENLRSCRELGVDLEADYDLPAGMCGLFVHISSSDVGRRYPAVEVGHALVSVRGRQ